MPPLVVCDYVSTIFCLCSLEKKSFGRRTKSVLNAKKLELNLFATFYKGVNYSDQLCTEIKASVKHDTMPLWSFSAWSLARNSKIDYLNYPKEIVISKLQFTFNDFKLVVFQLSIFGTHSIFIRVSNRFRICFYLCCTGNAVPKVKVICIYMSIKIGIYGCGKRFVHFLFLSGTRQAIYFRDNKVHLVFSLELAASKSESPFIGFLSCGN